MLASQGGDVAGRDCDWGDLAVRLLTSTGRDRDVAEWQACAEVVRSLDQYRPGDAPRVGTLPEQEQVRRLRQFRDIADIREAAMAFPLAFGYFRSAVLDFEAVEAAKLQTVLWCLRVLYRLRDQARDTDAIDALATRIGDLLTVEWRCADVPLTGDFREWSTASTRRYDLLPKSWRYV